MGLGELGERGVIERIARAARARGSRSPAVTLGIGDDAALLRPPRGQELVVSTDASFEDVHFRFRNESARSVGRRALVANLSDLAAMGARPLAFLLALAAPASLELRRLDALLAGLLHESQAHGCPLVGGNLARSRQLSLTITVLGSVPRGRALRRAGSRLGDRICVTGTLGGSALQRARAEAGRGRIRHVPEPRLRAGQRLLGEAALGGCIDVSDGLEADLEQLLAPAGLAAELDPSRIPRPRGFEAACRRAGLDAERLARSGGEDYELLFTLRPRAASAAVLSRRRGGAVSEIGRVVRAPGGARPGPRGYRHF